MAAKQTSLFGGFADPKFITTDPDPEKTDKYITNEAIPSRHLGKNFKVGRPKKGKTADVFFEKVFLTQASQEQNKGKSDTYEDPGRRERQAVAEAKKKNLGRDWKFASPPKKPTGSGSFVGTLQNKPFEHKPDYKVVQRGDQPERPKPQLRNIKTAPGKKGTYGVPGTTFSKFEAPKESDVYGQARLNEKKAWEESKKKNLGGVWKSLGHLKGTFDEKGATGVSSAYDSQPIPEPKVPKKPPKEDKNKLELKPFKYSSPAKSGEHGCFSKFPNTRGDAPDPYDSYKQKMKEDKAKGPKPLGGKWKPVSGGKSSVVRSLLKVYY